MEYHERCFRAEIMHAFLGLLAESVHKDGSRQLCIIHDKRLKLPLTLKRR